MNNILEIEGVSKIYRSRNKTVHALSNMNLTVREGEVFGFLGPNGAGKSTTIKIVMGLISATTGLVKLCGVSVAETNARRKCAYLPENPSFYGFLTAREYLFFVGKSFDMDSHHIKDESNRMLKLMGIEHAANRLIKTYSKGMVQRLGLAQAMLHDPDIYILDEPMSGLDPLGRALVKDIIRDLKAKGKTVFFSTHITSDVEIVCDRVGIIVSGQIKIVDAVARIMQSGIEGYWIQVRGNIDDCLLNSWPVRERSTGTTEVFVPKSDIKLLMQKLAHSNAEFEYIEPKRRDLESLLLEVAIGDRK